MRMRIHQIAFAIFARIRSKIDRRRNRTITAPGRRRLHHLFNHPKYIHYISYPLWIFICMMNVQYKTQTETSLFKMWKSWIKYLFSFCLINFIENVSNQFRFCAIFAASAVRQQAASQTDGEMKRWGDGLRRDHCCKSIIKNIRWKVVKELAH